MLPIHAPLRSTILSEVAKNRESPIPQPIVIIGASGSGKTTLLKQLSEALLKADQKTLWIDGRYIFSSDKITDLINQTSPNVMIWITISLAATTMNNTVCADNYIMKAHPC